MKILLKFNAKIKKNTYDITPLLTTNITKYSKIIKYLITKQNSKKQKKINALKLLKTTYINKKKNILNAINF